MCWQWPAVTWVDSIRRSFICAVVIREEVGEERYLFWEASTSLLSFESNKGQCWQEHRLEIKNAMSLLDKGSSKNNQTQKHCHNIFCHCYGGSESKLRFWGKFCFLVAPKFSSFYFPSKASDIFFFLTGLRQCPHSFLWLHTDFLNPTYYFSPKDWNIFFSSNNVITSSFLFLPLTISYLLYITLSYSKLLWITLLLFSLLQAWQDCCCRPVFVRMEEFDEIICRNLSGEMQSISTEQVS